MAASKHSERVAFIILCSYCVDKEQNSFGCWISAVSTSQLLCLSATTFNNYLVMSVISSPAPLLWKCFLNPCASEFGCNSYPLLPTLFCFTPAGKVPSYWRKKCGERNM